MLYYTNMPSDTETNTLAERFSALLSLVDEQTKSHSSFMKTVNSELKSLQKELQKDQSKSRKKPKKEPELDENGDVVKRKNVFDVPVQIGEELCVFLGLEKGQMYSRQFITNSITKYVKDNELQNPENRRYILLDTNDAGRKLGALLNPDQPLTFFNMQRYLKPHYPKSDTDRTDTTTSTDTETKKPTRRKAAKAEPVKVEPVKAETAEEMVVEEEVVTEESKKKSRKATRKA